MRVTIDLPDDLLAKAKRCAAARHTTLRDIVVSGLRKELGMPTNAKVNWAVVDGGLPDGLDISSRAEMMDWLLRYRNLDQQL